MRMCTYSKILSKIHRLKIPVKTSKVVLNCGLAAEHKSNKKCNCKAKDSLWRGREVF